MKMLNEKALEAARSAVKATAIYNPTGDISTLADPAIRAYLSAITPAEAGGLVAELRCEDFRHEMQHLRSYEEIDRLFQQAASALEAKEAELSALRMIADSQVVSHRDFNTVRADKSESALASERAAHAETKARLAEALKALETFAEIAGEPWADENGWTNAACQNDRICDWFGPSAFRAARRVREGGSNG